MAADSTLAAVLGVQFPRGFAVGRCAGRGMNAPFVEVPTPSLPGQDLSQEVELRGVPVPIPVILRDKGPSPLSLKVLRHLLLGYPRKSDALFLLDGFQFSFHIPFQGHRSSYPKGASLNDGIPEHLCSVRYTSFDQAVSVVHDCGVGAGMAKCDIKSAFCLLPVHHDDFELLGFAFQGEFYKDRVLPIGCSVSCAAFVKLSSFLEWSLRQKTGFIHTAHYLDDFLLVGPISSGQCAQLLWGFLDLAMELNVPLAHEKTEGPVQVLTFLGVELDTVQQMSRLPEAKLLALRDMIRSFRGRRKATLRELQHLIGHLNFTCKVVSPGRAFLRRQCDATRGLKLHHHRVRLSVGIREDHLVWEELNNTEGIERRTIWDASKAYIRGLAIQYRIGRSKEKNKKLKKKEESTKKTNSKKIIENIKLIYQINLLLTEEMTIKLGYTRQKK